MKTLVVLPSYNESGNITQLMEAILQSSPDISICVVDDNSPDGTSKLVGDFIQTHAQKNRMHLITRQKKDGRGGAVRDGFLWGLKHEHQFQNFVEMDCDFSHDPKHLTQGVKLLQSADFVIGSRYPDGKIVGWPMKRKILSACSNFLTRSLISWSVHDYTNGYRFYSRKAANFLCQQPQRFKGYIYLSECLALLIKNGFRGATFPITFVNRKVGASNTTFSEVFSSLLAIFQIAWAFRFQRR